MKLDLPATIRTSRLILQRLRAEDAEEIYHAYASKPEVTKYMAWPTHSTIKDTRDFLKYAVHAWDTGSDYSYSVRLPETNRLIGSFGVINDNGKIQFGYVYSPTQWGRGYATEVCMEMMKLLREVTAIYRIGTFVDIENVASCRVLEKCGLVEEARLARWFRFVNQGNQPKDCVLYRFEI